MSDSKRMPPEEFAKLVDELADEFKTILRSADEIAGFIEDHKHLETAPEIPQKLVVKALQGTMALGLVAEGIERSKKLFANIALLAAGQTLKKLGKDRPKDGVLTINLDEQPESGKEIPSEQELIRMLNDPKLRETPVH